MGWAGGTYDFALNTSESNMNMEIQESLEQERGYMDPVHQRLLLLKDEPIADGYDAAESRLSELYNKYGRKYNYGIKYRDYSNVKPSKKMAEFQRRIAELKEKIVSYGEEHSVLNFKAEFVGCPQCKSKLKRVLLHSDRCPLCRTDMRSTTTLKTIEGYRDKIKELETQIREEEKKMSKKAEIRWLVNAEAYLG